ncbi:MAG TPA: hypothetical protein VN901_02845, partial [Candidatus Acidoferrales bacterium]|nr:hypothetical protein [Candidatus Acidoferrales bacterium]
IGSECGLAVTTMFFSKYGDGRMPAGKLIVFNRELQYALMVGGVMVHALAVHQTRPGNRS